MGIEVIVCDSLGDFVGEVLATLQSSKVVQLLLNLLLLLRAIVFAKEMGWNWNEMCYR
jgi:hypothetical protein